MFSVSSSALLRYARSLSGGAIATQIAALVLALSLRKTPLEVFTYLEPNVFIDIATKSIDGKFNHEHARGIARSEFLKDQILKSLSLGARISSTAFIITSNFNRAKPSARSENAIFT